LALFVAAGDPTATVAAINNRSSLSNPFFDFAGTLFPKSSIDLHGTLYYRQFKNQSRPDFL
jgi:hypothetical protein